METKRVHSFSRCKWYCSMHDITSTSNCFFVLTHAPYVASSRVLHYLVGSFYLHLHLSAFQMATKV